MACSQLTGLPIPNFHPDPRPGSVLAITQAQADPDAATLAAVYGYGLSRNHAFLDGNKRTGFVATALFLRLDGCQLKASDADYVLTMLAVAAGTITEEAFADWLCANSAPRG